MKNILTTHVLPLLVGGIVCSCVFAQAQNLINISTVQSNSTFTVANTNIDITFRLFSEDGDFALTNSGGGTAALYPTLRLVVNGDVAWATLVDCAPVSAEEGYITDVTFRYTVKSGDMASPLKIYLSSAATSTAYQFCWNGWTVINLVTGCNAVWQINEAFVENGFGSAQEYLDFSNRNVKIQTLAFDSDRSPSTSAAMVAATWHVTTVNPVEKDAVYLYVWTTNTNVVQIGRASGASALLVSLAAGTNDVSFPVEGLAIGTADIYVQRTTDYQNNDTVGLANYIKRTITITPQLQSVATPVFTLASGTRATNSVTFAILCSTEGATIRYTLDGSEPSVESAVFSNALKLTQSAVVKARAFKSGMLDSTVGTATYTVIFSGFDIGNVKILCKDKAGSYSLTRSQPLITDEVGVEACIDNVRLAPSNIQMYVSYYVGTNNWGVNNWPSNQVITKPMYPTMGNPFVYRTSPTNDIPSQRQDQVVQYQVWASYIDDIVRFGVQKTFDNPAWYFPVDLNQTFAAQGVSPYYIVYGAPAGAVWINEVNALDWIVDDTGQWDAIAKNSYIEIAVPAGLDLAGWSVDFVKGDYTTVRTITLPSGMAQQKAVTNGYAFFVIGDTDRKANVPALPKMDYGCQGLANDMPAYVAGGLRLRRPLGVYEQAIAYDYDPTWGSPFSGAFFAENDPEKQFVYVGKEGDGGSLGVVGTTTTNWFFPQTWTPGWLNGAQTVPLAQETMQGVEWVEPPVFTPPSGTSASNVLNVTMTCETVGATIRYTLDGSVPTAESAIYTDAIPITQSATVKAVALKEGLLGSATAAAIYTLTVPDFDINKVRILCKNNDGTYNMTRCQPFASEQVGVEATISNLQLAPSNIQMFVSYYIGTNVWGVGNWPSDQVVTKPLYPISDDAFVYRTSPTNDIPAQFCDQVVQYRVWASYLGWVVRQEVQKTFENTAWFYQVDLNAAFAAQGWSPYYIVYGSGSSSAWPLDIVSISSAQANTTCVASGSGVDFKLTLAGKFDLVSTSGGTYERLPETRVIVNNEIALATLCSLYTYKVGANNLDRTDLVFRYVVKPGDMAQPLTIYGPPSVPYLFNWNGWEVRNVVTDRAAVWKFNIGLSLSAEGEVCDPDLTGANITIRALAFDEIHSPKLLTKKIASCWRVTTDSPAEGTGIDFYVWTPGTNLVQIGSVSNQTAILVNMPAGSTQVDFPLQGLDVGTTEIYVQRTNDYWNNRVIGVTNAICRTITFVAPPPPLIRVVMTDTGTASITMDESASADTGSFQIELSEVFTNDVCVRIDSTPIGQSNVVFDTSPFIVRIPAGSLVSPVSHFSAADGEFFYFNGIILTPVITNTDAAAYYSRIESATVYVRNIAPVLQQPANYKTFTAQRGMPLAIDWSVNDGTADLAAGPTVTWYFGDGTSQTVCGADGQIVHTFATAGHYVGTVYVCDKKGIRSSTHSLLFSVEQPMVSVVPSAVVYPETTTNETGSLMVYLSTAFTEDVWVQLTTSLHGNTQSNLVLATDIIRIPQGSTNVSTAVTFCLLDGTLLSGHYGIIITPTVTNNTAAAVFTERQSACVFVTNCAPVITQPIARALLPCEAVIGRPFTFHYAVDDVPADQESMAVNCSFWDGGVSVTTGVTGTVTHTFSTLGYQACHMNAIDKDGECSTWTLFWINVVPVPPPPSVSVKAVPNSLQETDLLNTSEVTVQLSEAFTNTVDVELTVTPVNSAVNGKLTLATNLVVFATGETQKIVELSLGDGTSLSLTNGFQIVPSVTTSMAASAYYTMMSSGTVTVSNASPEILYPFASDITGDALYIVPQGESWGFNWVVSDVTADLSTLSVTWNFGDGESQNISGRSGFVSHTYAVTGDKIVCMAVCDKDGGQNEVQFKICVLSPKSFLMWAARKGLSGDGSALFQSDRNCDGVANGFEYAFGTNLTSGVPLLKIQMIAGVPVVETPLRDLDTTADVSVAVEGCTNLFLGEWTLPMRPSCRFGKPDDRNWFEPLITVTNNAFFRLRAVQD